jgi:peptide/nickel transport system substrate-binding protein
VLGFDVRVVITDFDTVVDLAFSREADGERPYDMYVLGWTLGNPAFPTYYERLFGEGAPANSTGYASPAFAAALTEYLGAYGHDGALGALWDMEETIARDLPYLVLYHPQIVEAYRSDRVEFGLHSVLGGIQARGGGLGDLTPVR